MRVTNSAVCGHFLNFASLAVLLSAAFLGTSRTAVVFGLVFLFLAVGIAHIASDMEETAASEYLPSETSERIRSSAMILYYAVAASSVCAAILAIFCLWSA